MSHIDKEKQKLVARIKRIRGQVDSIERSLTTGDDSAQMSECFWPMFEVESTASWRRFSKTTSAYT